MPAKKGKTFSIPGKYRSKTFQIIYLGQWWILLSKLSFICVLFKVVIQMIVISWNTFIAKKLFHEFDCARNYVIVKGR